MEPGESFNQFKVSVKKGFVRDAKERFYFFCVITILSILGGWFIHYFLYMFSGITFITSIHEYNWWKVKEKELKKLLAEVL